MAAQYRFELGRGDLESFDLDEFLEPVHQEQVASGVESGQVAVCSQPRETWVDSISFLMVLAFPRQAGRVRLKVRRKTMTGSS